MTRCQLCGEFIEPGKLYVSAQAEACNSCICDLIDNEVERRMERQAERDFSAYHGGTAPYPFTDQERQEEQARIQRELK